MRRIIEVRILVDIPEDMDTHQWLKANLAATNAIDWEQGDSYPEEEAPLQ